MLRRIFGNSNNARMLGRWQISDNRSEIRAAMANIDSCGDSLCGDPKTIKSAIDVLDIKIKKYEDDLKKLNELEENKNKNFFNF